MVKTKVNYSRRGFLNTIGVAGAAAMLSPLAAWTIDGIDPRVAAIVAATMGIDSHNHIDVPINASELPGPDIDLAGEMKKSGLTAICMTFALDYQKLSKEGDAYERFMTVMSAMDTALRKNGMKRSLNLADLQSAHKKHQPTVIQSIEGSHFLEGHLDRLKVAYDRGMRHITLLHDSDASVPLGDVFTNPVRYNGLTPFGADVIRECNRLGILVDMSHASADTVDAALKIAAHPVIVSHTGLDTKLGDNEFMAKMMKPRLISKERAKVVADAGGVIGVWTHLADSPLAYAQNIRALVDIVGVDHVCIGTDTKLTPAYRSPNDQGPGQGPRPGGDQGQRPANDQGGHPDGPPQGGNGQRGPDKNRGGQSTNTTWADQKAGFYYAVVDGLLKVGFNEGEIGKIGGGNFCRVFDAATAGH